MRPSIHAPQAPACVLRPLVGVNRARTPALHAGTQTTRGHVRVTPLRASGACAAAPDAATVASKESRELLLAAGIARARLGQTSPGWLSVGGGLQVRPVPAA